MKKYYLLITYVLVVCFFLIQVYGKSLYSLGIESGPGELCFFTPKLLVLSLLVQHLSCSSLCVRNGT